MGETMVGILTIFSVLGLYVEVVFATLRPLQHTERQLPVFPSSSSSHLFLVVTFITMKPGIAYCSLEEFEVSKRGDE